MRLALRSPKLRRIVAAYTINRLGTWFGYVALSVTVFEHTHSALGVAALLVTGQAIPALLVPVLVSRVEASSRRSRLSALYLFEALASVGLALLIWNFSLPAILLLVALDGTAALAANALLRAEAARVARAESAASLRDPIDRDEQAATAERAANAALNMAFSLTFVMGPALAGLVVAGAGAPAALLIDAGSFLICGAMLLDFGLAPDEGEARGIGTRLRAAWGYIREARTLRALLLAESIALIFFAADASIEVPYAKATLHAGDRGYGLLLTVWGIGAAIGSVVFARAIRRPIGVMLIAGTAGVGLAYVGFAVAPSLGLACIASIVGGAGNGVQWASLISGVQQLTPPNLQGRLMGAVEAMGALFPALGLILGGVLAATTSTRTAFLTVGLGSLCMIAVFVRLTAGSELSRPPRRTEPPARAGGEPIKAVTMSDPIAVDRADL